jgi:predicted RNase H-like HicB family nuclease
MTRPPKLKEEPMRLSYSAVFEPARDGFSVYFPDLDGCTSFGEDMESALRNAEDALSLHLEGMAEDGADFVHPTAAWDVVQELGREKQPGVVQIVSAEAPDNSERVNVYLSRSLLERIDRYVAEANINRSSFFGLAASRFLAEEKQGAGKRAARR